MCMFSCKKQLVLIQLHKRLQCSSATYVKAFHAIADFLYFEEILYAHIDTNSVIRLGILCESYQIVLENHINFKVFYVVFEIICFVALNTHVFHKILFVVVSIFYHISLKCWSF